jgi:NAD+ synthase (glutamine-hydrolysing)
MKIALAQINPIVGDLEYNYLIILSFCRHAHELGADLLVFPELSLLGYPPKDLLLREDFLHAQTKYLEKITKNTPIDTLVGAAIRQDNNFQPHNVAVLCQKDCGWSVVTQKILLPNYNVFDEKRYFASAKENACQVLIIKGKKILISICEDAWNFMPQDDFFKYEIDPIGNAIKKHGKVDFIVNMSASPFTSTKPKIRRKIFTHIAKYYQTPVILVGQVGGNDQLLFDGHSMIIDSQGKITQQAKLNAQDCLIYDAKNLINIEAKKTTLTKCDLLIEMLTLGIRDYIEKCRAQGVILGVSGGIDSAVCAALAVRALGKNKVRIVFLPSQFSSEQSHIDAHELANNLSLDLEVIYLEESIQNLRNLLIGKISQCLAKNADIVDQNLQSRLRGLIIMALSNASGHLMIATSNKSELAVGYSTIYGDMCGAFSPLGDVYKTKIFKLAKKINQDKKIIPQSIIEKPPSAELKPDQLDTDTLPDYYILDKILFHYVDLDKSAQEIQVLTSYDQSLINKVIGMVHRSEFKRRQAPFALMVSDKVFGDARRMPIAKNMPIFNLSNHCILGNT